MTESSRLAAARGARPVSALALPCAAPRVARARDVAAGVKPESTYEYAASAGLKTELRSLDRRSADRATEPGIQPGLAF